MTIKGKGIYFRSVVGLATNEEHRQLVIIFRDLPTKEVAEKACDFFKQIKFFNPGKVFEQKDGGWRVEVTIAWEKATEASPQENPA